MDNKMIEKLTVFVKRDHKNLKNGARPGGETRKIPFKGKQES